MRNFLRITVQEVAMWLEGNNYGGCRGFRGVIGGFGWQEVAHHGDWLLIGLRLNERREIPPLREVALADAIKLIPTCPGMLTVRSYMTRLSDICMRAPTRNPGTGWSGA